MDDNKFKIRLLEPGEEKALAEFRLESAARHLKKHDFSHWQWQYCHDNNFSPSTCYIYVCWHKGKIVGQRPLMPFTLNIKGHSVPAVWGTDFLIHCDYRKMGIGTKLINAVLQDKQVYFALNSGTGSINIYKKFNAIFLPHVSRYTYPHRLDEYINKRNRFSFIKTVVSQPANLLISLRNSFYNRVNYTDINLIKPDRFTSKNESLGKTSSKNKLITIDRKLTFLKHRFNKAPECPYQILIAQKDNQDVGYIIWRKITKTSYAIIDIWAQEIDRSILQTLLHAVLKKNQSQKGQLTSCIASHPYLQSILTTCGFIKSKGPTTSMAVHPANSGIDRKLLQDLNAWYITFMDSDLDPVYQFQKKELEQRSLNHNKH